MIGAKKNRNQTLEADQQQNRCYLNNLEHRQAAIRETIRDILILKEQTEH